jgi:transposase
VTKDWGAIALYLGYKDELEMLLDMYVEQGLSCKEIATRVGMGQPTVLRRLRLAGIERRPRGGALSTQRLWYKLYLMDQRYVFWISLTVIARQLKVSISLVYKYKRGVKGGWSGFLPDSTDKRIAEVPEQT